MQHVSSPWSTGRSFAWQWACICLVLWLAGCAAPPKPVPPVVPVVPPQVQPAPPVPAPVAPPVTVAPEPPAVEAPPVKTSHAASPREYRKDAAGHLYEKYADRVYAGKLPPLLQAVGVLELDIGRRGEVVALRWTRPPRQVPKVMAEIESMVHAAAPFPAPVRMGKTSYTEVWLWHKSGRFQLDSLTEGQK